MKTKLKQKIWTERELMSLPDNGNKYELVNGEIIMGPAGFEHGEIIMRLATALRVYAIQKKLGTVLDSSTGFWMKNGNCRSPDISFIKKDRLKGFKSLPKGFIEGAPDLAIEVLSPTDSIENTHAKITEYFDSGAKLVWIINPEDQTVHIYHSKHPYKLLLPEDYIDGEDLIPGFSMKIAELFTEFEF